MSVKGSAKLAAAGRRPIRVLRMLTGQLGPSRGHDIVAKRRQRTAYLTDRVLRHAQRGQRVGEVCYDGVEVAIPDTEPGVRGGHVPAREDLRAADRGRDERALVSLEVLHVSAGEVLREPPVGQNAGVKVVDCGADGDRPRQCCRRCSRADSSQQAVQGLVVPSVSQHGRSTWSGTGIRLERRVLRKRSLRG